MINVADMAEQRIRHSEHTGLHKVTTRRTQVHAENDTQSKSETGLPTCNQYWMLQSSIYIIKEEGSGICARMGARRPYSGLITH